MNENVNLTKILKNCPKGWEFYSSVFGDVKFYEVGNNYVRIERVGEIFRLPSNGRMYEHSEGECIIFPEREQRDWSKFTAPWYKKDKFDPKTLQPFDKVLVRDDESLMWKINMFSYIDNNRMYPYVCLLSCYRYCFPYNEETKHLVGTTDEAPEYYRYWKE